jgi:hypothetical protein
LKIFALTNVPNILEIRRQTNLIFAARSSKRREQAAVAFRASLEKSLLLYVARSLTAALASAASTFSSFDAD